MFSSMKVIRLEDQEKFAVMQKDYLRTLIAPMDGMWEGMTIADSIVWKIQDQGRSAGFFCLDADGRLLRFFLSEDYQQNAYSIFSWVLSTYHVRSAFVSTMEAFFFSLCLDKQSRVKTHAYLFHHDLKVIEPSIDQSALCLKLAKESDLQDVVTFYERNAGGPGDWIEPFLHRRFERNELLLLYKEQMLVAAGECIPSQLQPPYADMGMVVEESQRRQGLGSFMIMQLKKRCYEHHWKPICSCEVINPASKRAIEKAGMLSEHRLVEVEFASIDTPQ